MSEPSPGVGVSDEMRVAVLENLSDGVYLVDRQRRILYWNKGAERITGFTADEVVGRRCKDNILNHCDEAGTILCETRCPLLETIRDGAVREAHMYLHHKDGHRKPVSVRAAPLHDGQGRIVGAVETFSDDRALADSRRRADDLTQDLLSDPLTGVGNRRLGEATLAGWIEQHRRFDRRFGILFVDVDLFKRVNDRYGHTIGDQALRAVARTLAATIRHGDEVVRWGGEEFVVLVADATPATLASISRRMRALVRRTRVFAEDQRVPLSISIGGTLVAPGDSSATIIRRADELLYESKAAGRNCVTLDINRAAADDAPAAALPRLTGSRRRLPEAPPEAALVR